MLYLFFFAVVVAFLLVFHWIMNKTVEVEEEE